MKNIIAHDRVFVLSWAHINTRPQPPTRVRPTPARNTFAHAYVKAIARHTHTQTRDTPARMHTPKCLKMKMLLRNRTRTYINIYIYAYIYHIYVHLAVYNGHLLTFAVNALSMTLVLTCSACVCEPNLANRRYMRRDTHAPHDNRALNTHDTIRILTWQTRRGDDTFCSTRSRAHERGAVCGFFVGRCVRARVFVCECVL